MNLSIFSDDLSLIMISCVHLLSSFLSEKQAKTYILLKIQYRQPKPKTSASHCNTAA